MRRPGFAPSFEIEPKMVHGRYGELAVLVDGREVIRAGWGAFIGGHAVGAVHR